jgi:hypothetical protein
MLGPIPHLRFWDNAGPIAIIDNGPPPTGCANGVGPLLRNSSVGLKTQSCGPGMVGSRTLAAASAPATGRRPFSSSPSWTSTVAWSQ